MIDLAVIPVAGRGTNLLPLTKSQPKEMLPVGPKPIVQYVVEELIHNECDRLLFVTGPDKSAIEDHFDINKELIWHLRRNGKEDILADLAFEREDATYFYTRQRHANGLGHAVLCAEPFVNDNPFVVALGDTILGREAPSKIVRQMVELFEQNRNTLDGVIAFDEVEPDEVAQYGIAKPGPEQAGISGGTFGSVFELEDLVEKPSVGAAPSRLAVAARYVFTPKIFEYLKRTEPGIDNVIQLTDGVRRMLHDGNRLLGVRLPKQDRRYDIGNFESYYKAFFDFAQKK